MVEVTISVDVDLCEDSSDSQGSAPFWRAIDLMSTRRSPSTQFPLAIRVCMVDRGSRDAVRAFFQDTVPGLLEMGRVSVQLHWQGCIPSFETIIPSKAS